MRTSRSIWKRPKTPFCCASLAPVVVRFCPSETANTWKMTTVPMSPISTPTMISTRVKPLASRGNLSLLMVWSSGESGVAHEGDRDVVARRNRLGGLPAQGDRHLAAAGGGRDDRHLGRIGVGARQEGLHLLHPAVRARGAAGGAAGDGVL